MKLLAALSRFFVMGVALVGLPFLVRNVLGLDAGFYGGAESAMAAAAVLGSVTAGLLTGRLKAGSLSPVLATIGLCILPAGQMVCGFLFDKFCDSISLVLLPSGVIAGTIGLLAAGFFRKLEEKVATSDGPEHKSE